MYESVESVYRDVLANVNVFVVNDSDKVIHDVKNEIDVGIENVVVNGYHHDHGIESARRDGQANVSPLCAECPAETGSAAKRNYASETRRV